MIQPPPQTRVEPLFHSAPQHDFRVPTPNGVARTGHQHGASLCCLTPPIPVGSSCIEIGKLFAAGSLPGFVLQVGDMAVAMFPQRCVGTAHGYRWPDILVVAARGGHRVTAVVELDGAPYHGNRDAEKRRDRELGGNVLHVDASEVGRPGLMAKIFDWLGGLLG